MRTAKKQTSLHEFQTEADGRRLSFWLLFGRKRCEESFDRFFGKPKAWLPRSALAELRAASLASLANVRAINFTSNANIKEVSVMITRKTRSVKAVFVAAGFLLAAFAMPGLSLASIDGLQISKALMQDFDMHHFNSDYHYYALMDAGNPYAIVGLEKGFRISGPYWKRVNPDSTRFSSLVNLVEESPVEGSITYAAYILDSQNRKIGTWYSSYIAGAAVNNRTKTVSITIHPNWLLN
jgi:hypothetical protein